MARKGKNKFNKSTVYDLDFTFTFLEFLLVLKTLDEEEKERAWREGRNLFLDGGGVRLRELALREGEEVEENDLERERERDGEREREEERESEREEEREREEEPEMEPEGERRPRLGFAMAMAMAMAMEHWPVTGTLPQKMSAELRERERHQDLWINPRSQYFITSRLQWKVFNYATTSR